MKKNILFIVIDSVSNDILFNKNNSKKIAPFLNELREKSISGDKMYSEAPFTEAALIALLGSIDTMDCGGYMERFKNKKCVLDIFKENGYKTFFETYYPSIYPSYMVTGYTERRYIEGFNFYHIWDYRLKYFSKLYLDKKTSVKENEMLKDMIDDNFKCWVEYLEKLKNKNIETEMLNDCVDISQIKNDIKKLKDEYKKFKINKNKYMVELFEQGEKHELFKIKKYHMTDKVHNDDLRMKFINKYRKVFNKIYKKNFCKNLLNNVFPLKKMVRCIFQKDFNTVKGLIAGYKNSLFDKDLYNRISKNYDMFKEQRSFNTVAETFFKWLDNNKNNKWMSYIHVDDAHFNESFFTYDTNDINLIDSEFQKINEYVDNLPKKYKGSITYDLSLLYCDNIIKKIFTYLEKNNILKDTAVVITADHGFSYYFSPVRDRYVISNYKENYNVPFIIYSDTIEKKYIDGYCSTKDIPATLLSLAGINKPNEFKGNDLTLSDGKDYALLEYMGGGCPDIYRRPINLGVRTKEYSVILNAKINEKFNKCEIVEVFDLISDPNEHINLKNKKNIETKISKELKILEIRFEEIKKQYKKGI